MIRYRELTPQQIAARATAVAKVARPTLPWREHYYVVNAVGVAIHYAITENA